MASIEIETESYRPLAEHLPRGKSFRELARELGHPHDYWYESARRDSATSSTEWRRTCEPAAGRYSRSLRGALDLAAGADAGAVLVDQLRARGWAVCARGVRIRGADEAALAEIVFVEQEEQP